MQIEKTRKLDGDPAAQQVVEYLEENQIELGLSDGVLYYGYPRYRDADGDLVAAKILVASPKHGVLVVGTYNSTHAGGDLSAVDTETDDLFGRLYGVLLGCRRLRKGKRDLSFWMDEVIYAPQLETAIDVEMTVNVIKGTGELPALLRQNKREFDRDVFDEIVAVIDGSSAIPRPKKRDISGVSETSKGAQVSRLEVELATFDNRQREASLTEIDGPQRIRGLAGSGKTIVLSKKAALAHLDFPDAVIGYTFYTKSLYQQIRRLITRFYRSEHDTDPNWKKLQVLHAWGGRDPGIYSETCRLHGVRSLTYSEAARLSPRDPFGYACNALLSSGVKLQPIFDYLFIDEGQDYPAPFIQLCTWLAKDVKLVYAYDELQTIFQTRAPGAGDIWGVDAAGKPNNEFQKDIVLYKCYRNPLEILVCAHALGFGIYGEIVQMLEDADHWRDVGYEVEEGNFLAGTEVVIRRPEKNSLLNISQQNDINEIVRANAFDSFQQEIVSVVSSIVSDISEGLRPDDILVVAVDDRNAQVYLAEIARGLAKENIACNNIHAAMGMVDFQKDGLVTLTTVHKAKGNEAFVVYVVGVDAVFNPPTKRSRNMIFTAMTRAKGWVRVSGVGAEAHECVKEIEEAKKNSPYIRFTYPGPERMELIRRDLGERAIVDQKMQRLLDGLPPEQIEAYLAQRRKRKGKK